MITFRQLSLSLTVRLDDRCENVVGHMFATLYGTDPLEQLGLGKIAQHLDFFVRVEHEASVL